MNSGKYYLFSEDNLIDVHKLREKLNAIVDNRVAHVIKSGEVLDIIKECEI
jgi:hypothetical protein